MSRWKAAAIHLSISAAIGLAAAALIFGVWYPPPYDYAAGAGVLMLLLLGVDIVLGPLLTLTVFSTSKKGLKFDLMIIAAIQACAFLYGMSVITRARPAFIVAAVDRFMLVTANDLDPADLAQGSKPKFRSVPWTGPELVGAKLPTDAKEHSELVFSGAAGKDVDKFPKYYVDYAEAAPALLRRAKPLDDLRAKHPEANATLDAWLHKNRMDTAQVVWVPLSSERQSMTMLLDQATGNVVGAVAVDPW